MRTMKASRAAAALGVLVLAHALPAVAQEAPAPAAPPAFKVAGGSVDAATLNGYRRYGNSCSACHGPDATGSSFAPVLADSLKRIDYVTFKATVMAGRIASETSVMPSFKNNPDVMANLDDIYRYLTARAVGGLPPGRPHKLEG